MLARLFDAYIRAFERAWNPSGELSSRLRLETRILFGRWLAIAFVAIALAFRPPTMVPIELAYGILIIALAYTIVLRKLIASGHKSVENEWQPASHR